MGDKVKFLHIQRIRDMTLYSVVARDYDMVSGVLSQGEYMIPLAYVSENLYTELKNNPELDLTIMELDWNG